jgi:hypothetical protein
MLKAITEIAHSEAKAQSDVVFRLHEKVFGNPIKPNYIRNLLNSESLQRNWSCVDTNHETMFT